MTGNEETLSGEKLFNQHSKQSHCVPVKGGYKQFNNEGSWMQSKQLLSFYESHQDILTEQRTEKLCNVVQGVWNPELKLIQFARELGKFWNNMGFVDKHRKWLYPEEGLYLMECKLLEVMYNEVPLSIQEAYNEFMSDSFQLEEYQVYCHLRRHGYLVRRHQSLPTDYELSIKLPQHTQKSKKRRKKTKNDTEDHKNECSDIKLRRLDLNESNNVQSPDMNNIMEEEKIDSTTTDNQFDNSHIDIHQFIQDYQVLLTSDLLKHELTTDKCDFSEIKFPNAAKSKIFVVDRLAQKYLPDNIDIDDGVRVDISVDEKIHPGLKSDFSHHDWTKLETKVQADNWKDYKVKYQKVLEDHDSPFSALWNGEVTPLLKPADATSTGDVLNKLQVVSMFDDNSSSVSPEKKSKLCFDVYLPNAKFKKSDPGFPNHRVYVTRCCDEPPTLQEINQVLLKDNVTVQWAVIENGDIAFYSFQPFQLPVDVSKG